jgi:sigma-54 dependent transcriptional regulator, flagellar regulatory protein
MSVPDDTSPSSDAVTIGTLPGRVLVLARDRERAARLETVLDFLECEPQVVSDRPDRDVCAQHDWLAWVVSGCLGDQLGDILNELPDLAPRVPVILVGDTADFPTLTQTAAAQVVRRVDYPARQPQLSDALQRARHVVANGGPDEARSLELFRSLVGSNPLVQRIRRLIEQVAATDANVLILGETGTGKEVVARNIHAGSARRERPFVAVNCGAIPADLLESELFGHEKGAFTGALSARQGRFELAQGGTLFLDEIGDMPLPMQVKLLRVLQERTFERVGSNRSIQCDVRIIAATHRDLEAAIDEGRFREDLYYRLNVFPIEVPPLRHRRGDLPLLISELTNRMEGEGRGSVRLGHSAMRALATYEWPGNVRELANLIERLAIMYPGETVEVSGLPAKFRREGDEELAELADEVMGEVVLGSEASLPRDGIDLKEYLNELEMGLIRRALDEADGVVAHAAKLLGMRRTTLVEKMRKFGISRPEDATEI